MKNNCLGECAKFVIRRLYGKRVKINTNPEPDKLTYEQQMKRLSRLLRKLGYTYVSFDFQGGKSTYGANAIYIAQVNHLHDDGHAIVCERGNILFDPSKAVKGKIYFPHTAMVILPIKGKK